MMYLSAQPDDVYFTWQLELQLRNFHSLGIRKEQIHVLFAMNPIAGLNPLVNEFIANNNELALIYCYPDTRLKKKYSPSVRPNIIKQHFKLYPELSDAVIFYHDSDILLSRIPEIPNLYDDDRCYVSDTRNYLDTNYIKSSGSEKLLEDMAKVVGISVNDIEKNDAHVGGAQNILKKVDYGFWDKLEGDCELISDVLESFNRKKWEYEYPETRQRRVKTVGIQSWCADMCYIMEFMVLWQMR